jgi:hypothetical protein
LPNNYSEEETKMNYLKNTEDHVIIETKIGKQERPVKMVIKKKNTYYWLLSYKFPGKDRVNKEVFRSPGEKPTMSDVMDLISAHTNTML